MQEAVAGARHRRRRMPSQKPAARPVRTALGAPGAVVAAGGCFVAVLLGLSLGHLPVTGPGVPVASGLLAGVLVVVLLRRQRDELTASLPVWWLLAIAVYYVLPLPAALAGAHNPGLNLAPQRADLLRALLTCAVSLFGIAVGWRAAPVGRAPTVSGDSPASVLRVWRLTLLAQTLSLGLLVASYRLAGAPLVSALTTVSAGGYGDDGISSSSVQFLAAGGNFGLVTAPLLLVAVARGRSRSWQCIAWCDFVLVLVLDILIGVRFRPFLLLIAVVILLSRPSGGAGNGSSSTRVRGLLALAVVASLLVPLSMAVEQARSPAAGTVHAGGWDRVATEVDLLTPSAVLERSTRESGTLGGRSYADVLTQLVPRAIRPHKPRPATLEALDRVADPRAGVAVSLVSEAYLNGGLLLVLLLSLLVGAGAAWAQERWRLSAGPLPAVGLALLGPVSAQSFSRGYAVQAVVALAYTMLPIVLLQLLSRRGQRSSVDAEIIADEAVT